MIIDNTHKQFQCYELIKIRKKKVLFFADISKTIVDSVNVQKFEIKMS